MIKTPWGAAEAVLKLLGDILVALRDVVAELKGFRTDMKELKDVLKSRPKQ